MTLKSKRNMVSLAAGFASFLAYLIFSLGKNAPATEDLKGWAVVMLIFIGISVAVQITAQVMFHILFAIGVAVKEGDKNEEKIKKIVTAETKEDEMDKRINLKSSRMGYVFAGLGFVAALFSLALGAAALIALHIILGACFIAAAAEGITAVFLYEKGVRNR